LNISPRETILKAVRKNLLGFKTGQNTKAEYKVDAYKSLSDAEGVQALIDIAEHTQHQVLECNNKYHFLDRFIDFQKRSETKTVFCRDIKLKRLLDSCDIEYTSELTEAYRDINLYPCDYWEPNGLLAAFDYSKDREGSTSLSGRMVLVTYRDQMVKTTENLFERLKNRLRDADLQKVDLYTLDPTLSTTESSHKGPVTLFIINQRL